MDRILLTGASGFIGSQVVALLQARGHAVLNLDLNPPAGDAARAVWRQADVRDGALIRREITAFAPDRIAHLASDIDVNITRLDQFKTTIEGTQNMLDAAAALPGLKRFLHTSTQFVVKPGVKARDETFLDPYTVYGEAKAITESKVRGAGLSAPWTIVRPVIIWGPRHPTFASQIFRHIASRRYLHPARAQPILRTFGYVGNTARQLTDLLLRDEAPGAPSMYYLGDATIDYDLWADAFALGLTGRKARRIPYALLRPMGWAGDALKALGLPAPLDSGRVFRMSTSSDIDLAPTHQAVGSPQIGFEQGVAETLAWLRSLPAYRQTRPLPP